MRIDIWSDVICPWCYLGKRRFDAALQQVEELGAVEVRYRAFELDPGAGAEPGDLRRSLEAKYGPGSFDQMTGRLVPLGEEVGITYRFDLAKRVNTADAHRLAAWAWDQGGVEAQGPLIERLFQAYFEEGANVADRGTLAALAADAGFDAAAAGALLDSEGQRDQVLVDRREARDRDITGVPAFVVDDHFVIPGAQDIATFVGLLRNISRMER